MKKLIFAFAALVVVAASCAKNEAPKISFDKQVYVLLADGSVDVKVEMSAAQSADVVVPITFEGDAVKGSDYTVSAESVTIAAGQTSGIVTIEALNNLAESSIKLAIAPVAGCELGKYPTATVTVEAKEKILYTFSSATATVLDSYKVKLNLTGLESGSKFVATADMEIPVKLAGDVESCTLSSDVIVVKKGDNYGSVTVYAGDVDFGDEAEVFISVDAEKAGSRFVEGETSTICLDIQGMLKLSTLVGTWAFDSVADVDELEYFFEEMEDDPALCPLKNEGFQFTVAEVKDEEGNVTGYTFTPNTTGQFAAYFREADITYTAPKNIASDGELVGEYCSIEYNMFVYDVFEDYLYNTYFELSNVNRSFDATAESLGKGVISISMNADGSVILSIHDYDCPPFGFMWWEDEKFDIELFSFASLFTKVE